MGQVHGGVFEKAKQGVNLCHFAIYKKASMNKGSCSPVKINRNRMFRA